ncbi:MAG: helix-turn-helix domain-containing protein [Bacteroidales bacterium]
MTSKKEILSPWQYAYKFVNNTDQNIFLTGKAGTGKTTFLKTILEDSYKKTVVAAPTGIAAINAGGVTLHSLLHLPFGCFVPDNFHKPNLKFTTEVHSPGTLIRSHRMNETKRNLIKETELLIIDEVSMLRADTLDAIDTILRHVKRKNSTFGGVQILFIGDLLQLPPVIRKDEKDILSSYYSSGYFFEAKALQEKYPIYIELEKVFRQVDKKFIGILNRLRENSITGADIQTLNNHYKPNFEPSENDGYIFLTTHNKKADQINQKALNNLPGKSFRFDAKVEGSFGEHLYPIPYQQEFKKGAQVMFIKNDYSGEQRYFNGKIGTISDISEEEIYVSFQDGTPDTPVEKYTWENKEFALNQKTKKIKEVIKGTFTHFPIKLAWAVTIHKSQGLTFEKAIIDVSQAFAPGQIYVALSRLTSLDGLILNTPIPQKNLNPPESLRNFIINKKHSEKLQNLYFNAFTSFIENSILDAFNFQDLYKSLNNHAATYQQDVKKSTKQKYKAWAMDLIDLGKELTRTSDKFQKQIIQICQNSYNGHQERLLERVKAARNYFEPLMEELYKKVISHMADMQKKKGTKKYTRELDNLASDIFKKIEEIHISETMLDAALSNQNITEKIHECKSSLQTKWEKIENEYTKQNEVKKNTKDITLELFQNGNSIEKIAEQRLLAVSTIEGHLSYFVEKGQLDVNQFIDKIKNAQIKKVAEMLATFKMNDIKSKLGDEFTYSDIRFALADLKSKSNNKNLKA